MVCSPTFSYFMYRACLNFQTWEIIVTNAKCISTAEHSPKFTV